MRVVIINPAVLNTGDAAIIYGTIEILRRAFGTDPGVVVCDQQADVAARHYPDLDFEPILHDQIHAWTGARYKKAGALAVLAVAFLWRIGLGSLAGRLLPPPLHAALCQRARADFIISTGGTYLIPHYRLLPKIYELLISIALGRPLVLFTQSLGPFPRHRRLFRFVFRRARLILVRDGRSRRHLLSLGVPRKRIIECADAAFALAGTAARQNTDARLPNRRLRIAVSVRDWPHFHGDTAEAMDRYLGAITETVAMLIERHDALVMFVSSCQGIDEYWTDDSHVADAVVERLPSELKSYIFVDRGFYPPHTLIEILGNYDIVIATRMHMAILAMCAGTPVIPIAYEFKTSELFSRLGLGEYVQDIESITGAGLCKTVEGLLVGRARLIEDLRRKVAQESRSAFTAGRHVAAALEEAP